MKLLIDMNLSPRWAKFVADAGFEAAHWSAIGAHTLVRTMRPTLKF